MAVRYQQMALFVLAVSLCMVLCGTSATTDLPIDVDYDYPDMYNLDDNNTMIDEPDDGSRYLTGAALRENNAVSTVSILVLLGTFWTNHWLL